jgi:short-subunit dehydrogenase
VIAGRRALLTGGSGGIGTAIAAELLTAGASVLLVGRDAAALQAAAARLGAPAGRVATFAADVADEAARARLVTFAAGWQGGVDVLVNNAGLADFAWLEEQTAARIDRLLEVNVHGPIQLCRALLPVLSHHVAADIVNVGSVFGSIGYPGQAVYSASKFALRGFSEALRRELAGSSVRVHYLAPRATRTAMNAGAMDRLNAELGVAMDEPAVVAAALRRMLERNTPFAVLGWPEKLFARLNAVLPRLVDGALRRQLPVIRRHATGTPPRDLPRRPVEESSP